MNIEAFKDMKKYLINEGIKPENIMTMEEFLEQVKIYNDRKMGV